METNTIAFLAGIVVGGFFVGLVFCLLLWMVTAYRKHPEWFDEDEEINIDFED